MPFVKGQSGNPAGRPVGSPNKFSRHMQDAFEHGAPIFIKQLFDLAGDGNPAAIRQCLDRLMGKQRPSSVALPAPDSPTYVFDALKEIHRALGAGEIASDEAIRLVDLVGRTARVLAAKAVAVIDFADRLERCEQALIALFNAARPATAQEPAAQPVPQLAVVNVLPTIRSWASWTSTVTFASKTFAVPETVTGLVTRSPLAGLPTVIAGSRST